MLPKRAQKVVAAYPHATYGSMRFHKCWDALRQYDFTHHQRISDGGGHLANSSGANVTNARNEIVTKFLDDHDADWLWFVDTDMTFEPDTLDRLVASAHPEKRPIMGALCFSLQDGWRACPTLYSPRADGNAGRVFNYPKNRVVRHWTGAGCILIHRSALEAIRARNFDPVYPWFQETRSHDTPIGEDITFCIRAESIGIPVHVDTSIKCGHEKTFVVDEQVYDAQQASNQYEPAEPERPTFAVVASKNRPEMLLALLKQLYSQVTDVFVLDNGYDPPLHLSLGIHAHGWPLHRMWNHGLDLAAKQADGPHNVLIVNDDVEVAPDVCALLEGGLRQHSQTAVAIPTTRIPHGTAAQVPPSDEYAGQTITGWCFMLRGEDGWRFDEQFEWWYGDTDLERQIRQAGRHVAAVGCNVRHLDPMRSTTGERLEQAKADEKRFAEKWGVDPDTLWLARHPEFGQ